MLPLLVADRDHSSILGVDWFEPLGIALVGVHHISSSALSPAAAFTNIIAELPDVFVSRFFALRPKVEQKIQRLLVQGLLELVANIKWGTPVVSVLKSDGSVRLCEDYKCTINCALRQDPYPVLAIMHLLADLVGDRYFVKLDLSQAYLQLQVNNAAARAQTIVTHRGAFLVKRLQFCMATAPGIFQQFIVFTCRCGWRALLFWQCSYIRAVFGTVAVAILYCFAAFSKCRGLSKTGKVHCWCGESQILGVSGIGKRHPTHRGQDTSWL